MVFILFKWPCAGALLMGHLPHMFCAVHWIYFNFLATIGQNIPSSETTKGWKSRRRRCVPALDPLMFPTVKNVGHVVITLSVRSSTCKRSFGVLRCPDTWLRSTMGENRLQHVQGFWLDRVHWNLCWRMTSLIVLQRCSTGGSHWSFPTINRGRLFTNPTFLKPWVVRVN